MIISEIFDTQPAKVFLFSSFTEEASQIYSKIPSDRIASVSILAKGKNRLFNEFRGGITTSIGAPISGHLKSAGG